MSAKWYWDKPLMAVLFCPSAHMIVSSHRLRVQEKRVFRSLVTRILLLVVALLLIIYAGLPILAKIILTFSSVRKEKASIESINQTFLFPPILNPLAEATNSAKVVVSGLGEGEVSIKIFVNGKEQEKVFADKDGLFQAKNIFLYEGENVITAKTLKGNKESSPSSPMTIIYKKNPPKIEITRPQEGEKFDSEEKEITIMGETEPGNKVYINDRLIIVDQHGKFSYEVSLTDGENVFKVKAIDAADNQTEIERKVTYTP